MTQSTLQLFEAKIETLKEQIEYRDTVLVEIYALLQDFKQKNLFQKIMTVGKLIALIQTLIAGLRAKGSNRIYHEINKSEDIQL